MIFPPPIEAGSIVTLPVLVAALAEETGERLAVAPELENEAIYLRRFALNGRTLPLLARVCAAEWERSGTKLTLTRSGHLKGKLAAEGAAALTQAIQTAYPAPPATMELSLYNQEFDSLTKSIEALAKGKISSAAFRESLDSLVKQADALKIMHRQADPSRRTLDRLMASADLRAMLQLAPQQSLSFSNREGFQTRRLSGSSAPLARFNSEAPAYRAWARAKRKDDPSFSEMLNPLNGTKVRESDGDDPTADVLFLTATRNVVRDLGFTVTLAILGRDGQALGIVHNSVELPSPTGSGIPKEGTWKSRPLDDVPEAKEALEWIQGSLSREEIGPGRLAPLLARNDKILDPLSVFVRPILDGLTEETSGPILIDVPDGTLSELGEAKTLFESDTAISKQIRWVKEADVLLGTPRYPLLATSARFPRRALAALLKLANADFVRLEDGSRYLQTVGGPKPLEAAIYHAISWEMVDTMDFRDEIFDVDRDIRPWVKLYAGIPAFGRKVLEGGGSVPLSDGTPLIRALAQDAFFALDSHYSDSADTPLALIHPRGLPSDLVLRGAHSTEVYLRGFHKGQVMDNYPPDALGRFLWQVESGERGGIGAGAVHLPVAHFLPYMAGETVLTPWVGGREMSAEVLSTTMPMIPQPVPLNRLPIDLLAPVRKGYEDQKKG
ncbi:hypothetical protein EON79_14020, partial [bacterium]